MRYFSLILLAMMHIACFGSEYEGVPWRVTCMAIVAGLAMTERMVHGLSCELCSKALEAHERSIAEYIGAEHLGRSWEEKLRMQVQFQDQRIMDNQIEFALRKEIIKHICSDIPDHRADVKNFIRESYPDYFGNDHD